MQGIIGRDLRGSFNLPWYFPNPDELRQAVGKCEDFVIENVQVCEGVPRISEEDFEAYIKYPAMFGCVKSNLVKSFVGTLVEAPTLGRTTDVFSGIFRKGRSVCAVQSTFQTGHLHGRFAYEKVVDNVSRIN